MGSKCVAMFIVQCNEVSHVTWMHGAFTNNIDCL